VFCLALLAAVRMIPFTALFDQNAQLNQTRHQIALVDAELAALHREASAVSSRGTEIALARQQYQLVEPGQSLIQVLPGQNALATGEQSGDPGLQPIVNPVAATSPTLALTSTTATSRTTSNFWTRLVRTLEFWR
jgi:large exoprotein involved in heme utilization and adhesion